MTLVIINKKVIVENITKFKPADLLVLHILSSDKNSSKTMMTELTKFTKTGDYQITVLRK
jgi:hypothetical protein